MATSRSVAGVRLGWSGWVRFVVALSIPLIAVVVLRAAPQAFRPLSWPLFIAGVFLSSWLGGLLAGLLAAATSTALEWFFFLAPVGSFAELVPENALSLAMLLFVGILVSISCDRLRTLQGARGALGRSEAKFDGIFAAVFDPIICIDEEERIVHFNKAAADVFLYTQEDVLGRPLALLIPEPFRSMHGRLVRPSASGPDAARVGSQRPLTILGLRKNGEEFPAEASISALDLDDRILFVVCLRDVSGEEEVRRELVQALDEQKFLAAIGEMFAFSLDPSETLRRVTQASVEFIADFLLLDLLVEGNLRRVKVACSDPAKADVARALEALPNDQFQPPPVWAAIENKETVVWLREASEETLRRSILDAEVRALVQAMQPKSSMHVPLIVRDKAIGVMTFVSSEPGRLYDPSRVRLAEEVARRAALALENSRLYKVTSDAVEARDQVLSIVAHDLRNPLNAIQLRAVMLLKQLNPDAGSKVERSVQAILDCSKRANRLIQDLLEVSRAQMGRLTLRNENVSARRMLLDIVETQQPLLSAADLLLRLDLPPNLPLVFADCDRVTQVFENIIGNAVKFTPKGGEITIGGREDANTVVFWVRDTGPGIPPHELSHLFDRFWQARETDRRGMGLGLLIAKQVVEAHGGKIWAESEVGRGTTLFFTMPKATPPDWEQAGHVAHA